MKTTDNLDELFIVVDKKDQLIGYRTRKECHHNKDLIHRGVHVVIFNDKGEILMQKRSKFKDLQPGYYSVAVGGHVTKGESYTNTARREMKEELGINVPFQRITKYLAVVPDQKEMITIYKGVCNGPFVLSTDEVESIQFFPANQLKKHHLPITPLSSLTLKELKIL